MTESLIINHEIPLDFVQNLCVSNKSWEILETIKREYERKIDKAGDDNDALRREIRYFILHFLIFSSFFKFLCIY